MQLESIATYKNKEIKVVVEFPEVSDKKAEQEFIGMLKEIYLNKIKIGSMQSESGAVESLPTDTKEDRSHE